LAHFRPPFGQAWGNLKRVVPFVVVAGCTAVVEASLKGAADVSFAQGMVRSLLR